MITQPRIDSRIEASSARLLHSHLATLDRAEARDEVVETLAAELYDRHIGGFMASVDIGEAIGEIFSGMDDAEMAACRAAYEAGAQAFGEWLHPQIEAYWQAWSVEQARQQLDRLDREAEEDHYREQVAA